MLARSLAPLLYVQRDEWFPLDRVVAVLNPTRRVIAYHLLWRDDVHGSWIPFTVPTDEEIVWVGYDSNATLRQIFGPFGMGTSFMPTGATAARSPSTSSGESTGHCRTARSQSDLPTWQKLNVFYCLHVDRPTGHLARRSHEARSLVLLPRVRAVPGFLEVDAARRAAGRRRPCRGSHRRVGRGVRQPVLAEETVAVMRTCCSYRSHPLALSCCVSSSIDSEEKQHGDTCQEVSREITEREA